MPRTSAGLRSWTTAHRTGGECLHAPAERGPTAEPAGPLRQPTSTLAKSGGAGVAHAAFPTDSVSPRSMPPHARRGFIGAMPSRSWAAAGPARWRGPSAGQEAPKGGRRSTTPGRPWPERETPPERGRRERSVAVVGIAATAASASPAVEKVAVATERTARRGQCQTGHRTRPGRARQSTASEPTGPWPTGPTRGRWS